mmetsp:Transcript_27286/g.78060  ORF Transcript_27286/g.78060 Transcript_27286/m.78060 type:complete len:202 (-) Transcript_27286:482-1087(-)
MSGLLSIGAQRSYCLPTGRKFPAPPPEPFALMRGTSNPPPPAGARAAAAAELPAPLPFGPPFSPILLAPLQLPLPLPPAPPPAPPPDLSPGAAPLPPPFRWENVLSCSFHCHHFFRFHSISSNIFPIPSRTMTYFSRNVVRAEATTSEKARRRLAMLVTSRSMRARTVGFTNSTSTWRRPWHKAAPSNVGRMKRPGSRTST